MPTWSSATMKMPLRTSFTMFCAPKPRPAPIAAERSVSEPSAVGASTETIMTSATMTMVTLTMFPRMDPRVLVRWTTRTAASGDRSSACVSSTLALFLWPETIRFTTRQMTILSSQARMKAPMTIPATASTL